MNSKNLFDKPDDESKVTQKQTVVHTFNNTIMYALAVVVGLGTNDFISTIFDSFGRKQHILGKAVYVMLMLGITVLCSYFLEYTWK